METIWFETVKLIVIDKLFDSRKYTGILRGYFFKSVSNLEIRDNFLSTKTATSCIRHDWHCGLKIYGLFWTVKLAVIDKSIDGRKYIDILQGHLFESVLNLRIRDDFLFQHDSILMHTARFIYNTKLYKFPWML